MFHHAARHNITNSYRDTVVCITMINMYTNTFIVTRYEMNDDDYIIF